MAISRAGLWLGAFVAVLVMSLLKTLRLPIEYPSGLMALTYEQGFTRRGLFGTLVFGWGGEIRYATVAALSLGILALLMLAFTLIAGRILRAHPALALACVLFASSLCIVYAASTTGYFDQLLLGIAALGVFAQGLRPRLALLVVGGTAAILLHEAALLVTVPVLLLSLALALTREGRRVWPLILPLGLAAVAMAGLVGLLGQLPPEAVASLRESLQARADFPLNGLAFEIIGEDALAHARLAVAPVNLVAHIDSLVMVAPALVPLLALALYATRRAGLPLALRALVLVAGLAPVLLRFVGSDIHRWDALAIGTSFLTLALVLGEARIAAAVPREMPRLQPLLAVALALSAASTTFLFRDQVIDPYPFFATRSHLIWLLR